MLQAYKYRMYPNKVQKEYFAKTFGCTRLIYNLMLSDKMEYYSETGKNLNVTPAMYKKDYPFLREVDSLALANAQMNLQSAYSNFFRDKSVGFPKYKSKKNNHLSYTTNNQNGTVAVCGNHIKLPKIGQVKIKYHREITGIIRSATVSQSPSGKYYVSVLAEVPEKDPLPVTEKMIGIDLGLKQLVITSDGKKFDNLKTLSKYEAKLVLLQRQLSHKVLNSNNYTKKRIQVARCHEKITNIRKDYLHKISHELICENQAIFSEDLKVKDMMMNSNPFSDSSSGNNHDLSRCISDASWSELTRQLQYKAEWHGRTYGKVDTFFPSSQLCHVCGYRNEKLKDLRIRVWTCPVCGTGHDRDINAAKNILAEGLKQYMSQ